MRADVRCIVTDFCHGTRSASRAGFLVHFTWPHSPCTTLRLHVKFRGSLPLRSSDRGAGGHGLTHMKRSG